MSKANPAVAPKENTRGRVLFASMIGTTVEFFDFYAYATASVLVFPALFFPNATTINAILSSFAIFGVAFLARPLGSVVFGHYGDKLGRKGTLVASLLLMGISTFLIGFLPPAQGMWTVLAPLALVLLRFAQGLALGGEWSGAALLATENAPKNKRAVYGTFPQLGAPVGFIIANLMFVFLQTSLTPEQFMAWGWRIPFYFSAVMVIIGLWVRLKLVESLSFQKVVSQDKVLKSPFKATMKHHWRPVVAGTFIMVATYVLFYLMTSFTLTYGTAPATEEAARAAAEAKGKVFDAAGFVPGLGIDRPVFLTMLIIGVVFFGIFTVASGPLAEKFGRRKFLIWVTVAILIFGAGWTLFFGPGQGAAMVGLIVGFTLMGLTFGPMAAYLPELFPSNVRYTGSAIAYNMSSVIGAAPASFVAIALWNAGGGNTVGVGIYLAIGAVLTLIALFMTRDTSDVDMEEFVE
ncbi:MFS transporter [Glutamicibacter soli]|uniref:MFS transporter n=1 Tax=Glutamicibacter soli TaxID=453836 RepID=A0A6L9G4L9_9MICC|nr:MULTISPECIES: MFS transporter [Micrococcaceae]ALD63219.1 major facilitator transporter [Arthrobacter sp. LS16]ALQ31547.1 MFS transporter [Arthrobacter sp. YC-RL1]KLI89975.1 major facilitator transporter [Arthrobacter sp. YC-RL1]NAZ15400.1 MFS transporter [Glutamicibacter soli]RKS20901.1 sugar phosphate permease [Arthrobacter sp. AG1021]